jgi:hypothetical protein
VDLAVESSPWSTIEALDVGSGERPPLLGEVLEEFAGGLYIDIELKTGRIGSDPFRQRWQPC